MVEKLIDAMKAEDWAAAADCFADGRDVRYSDYCPSRVGLDDRFIWGHNAVELYFRDKFYNRTFFILEERIEDEKNATFFGCYSGKYCYCKLTVEETDGNGKIIRAAVRPA